MAASLETSTGKESRLETLSSPTVLHGDGTGRGEAGANDANVFPITNMNRCRLSDSKLSLDAGI